MEKQAVIETEVEGLPMRKTSAYGHVELEVPPITWYKHAGLRKLYLMMPILFLGSTINGYDGSLLNGLQTMIPWQNCTQCQRFSEKTMLTLGSLRPSRRITTRVIHGNSEHRRRLRHLLLYALLPRYPHGPTNV
jgi:hypothetical protein